jgi:hypothetical protein
VRGAQGPKHEKIGVFPIQQNENTMIEAERVNLIGTTLADLTSRTQELRGYL